MVPPESQLNVARVFTREAFDSRPSRLMLASLEKDPIITALVAPQKQIFARPGTPISRLAILWPQATVGVRQLAATFSSGQACLARPALRCLPTLLLGGLS